MSHELTHALEDQSFHIDPWIKAARPNDDAELARDAVSEGSAMAAMVDYQMLDQKLGVRDLPDVTFLIRAGAVSEMDKDPNLAKAPIYIRDELLFPYLAGTGFTQQFLKAHTGWQDLHLIFQNPPVSTQQIIHPDLYLQECETRGGYASAMERLGAGRLEATGRKYDGRIRPRRDLEAVPRRESSGLALAGLERRSIRYVRRRQNESPSAGVSSRIGQC